MNDSHDWLSWEFPFSSTKNTQTKTKKPIKAKRFRINLRQNLNIFYKLFSNIIKKSQKSRYLACLKQKKFLNLKMSRLFRLKAFEFISKIILLSLLSVSCNSLSPRDKGYALKKRPAPIPNSSLDIFGNNNQYHQQVYNIRPVSYTHLTLPTILRV